jgi:hypothetical protein
LAFHREYLEPKFKRLKAKNCQFVLFLADGKRKAAHPGNVHHVMKLMEQQHSRIGGRGEGEGKCPRQR